MATTRSAAKRLRQSIKRHLANQAAKSAMKTAIRKCQRAAQQDLAEAWRLLPLAQKAIDKAAKRGAIHPNQAARRKSRLVAYLKRLESARTAEATPAHPAAS
ncbi:30S ribosomal protein S20 [Geochorda subterranea]|uniref:Small ribosomal subunit protein bS20 n=1 Tax=Geochorda subterranea TaxID=3109564 RepID=A0ABZ1BN46_9FIRM|nr:30S ribosomal protein S20 [Limnochorda sp. LNt]WRP13552.1 30S ribosomal protein S20 [Limnochorda sp. LNt]